MIWRAQEILDCLDAYAERIGKRERSSAPRQDSNLRPRD